MGEGSDARPLELFVLRTVAAEPELGHTRLAAKAKEQGLAASVNSVRSILERRGLETFYKRAAAAGALKGGGAGRARLNERQLARLRRARRTHEVLASVAAGSPGSRSSVRRTHLLTVAAEVFSQHGYENATLKQIAEAAGLLPGSVYHYFKSKDDLFAKVLHQGFRQLNAAVDAALAPIADPWDRLMALCRVHLEQPLVGDAIDALTAHSILVKDSRHLDRRLIRERESYEKRFRAVVAQLPLPADIDRSILRLTLLGALNWSTLWLRDDGRLSRSEVARRIVALLRR